jgi:hypothetical protein
MIVGNPFEIESVIISFVSPSFHHPSPPPFFDGQKLKREKYCVSVVG